MTRSPLTEPKPYVAGLSRVEGGTPPPGRLLTAKQAAHFVGLSVKTLAQYRCFGGGPAFYKLSRFVRYDENELATWMRSRHFSSTSQESAG